MDPKTVHALYPPDIVNIGTAQSIFLAGPIQGAALWHQSAIEIISAANPEVFIASPSRLERISGGLQGSDYRAQIDWETFYLNHAGRYGVIMFWLARETEHNCGRAYAQTSRFELGEWKIRHQREGARLAIGIEPGFTNERYLQYRLGQDCPEIPIYDTLEQTCREAVESCQARNRLDFSGKHSFLDL